MSCTSSSVKPIETRINDVQAVIRKGISTRVSFCSNAVVVGGKTSDVITINWMVKEINGERDAIFLE